MYPESTGSPLLYAMALHLEVESYWIRMTT